MKEEKLKEILKIWLSDCSVKVDYMHDDDVGFFYYFVVVHTKCAFSLKCLHDFERFLKKAYDLDCCEYHFDFGCGFFSFEMF